MEHAHNDLLDLEELEENDLSPFRKHYEEVTERRVPRSRAGGRDADSPFLENQDDNDDDREAARIKMTRRPPCRNAVSQRAARSIVTAPRNCRLRSAMRSKAVCRTPTLGALRWSGALKPSTATTACRVPAAAWRQKDTPVQSHRLDTHDQLAGGPDEVA